MAKRKPVRRPYERIKKNVVNQSGRNGIKPRLIVLHSTESHNRPGTLDLASICDWFNNPNAQASSHVLVDNEGYSAVCVPDEAKAWTQSNYNSVSLSIEQIGQAAQLPSAWLVNNRAQIRKAAKYLAYWSKKYDIPLEVGQVSALGTVIKPGVVTHMMLGILGGGHVDPGRGYPLKAVITAARYYKRWGWK